MDLLEYQGKQLFARHGIPVPEGRHAPTVDEAAAAAVDSDLVRPIGAFLKQLYDVFVAEEATLVEVNPLIVTPERAVRALDAKVTLDDNALFRHPQNAELRDPSAEDPQERMAKER